jgi:hypothetical protein
VALGSCGMRSLFWFAFRNIAGPAFGFGRTLFVFCIGFQEAKFDDWSVEFSSIVTDSCGPDYSVRTNKHLRYQSQRPKSSWCFVVDDQDDVSDT